MKLALIFFVLFGFGGYLFFVSFDSEEMEEEAVEIVEQLKKDKEFTRKIASVNKELTKGSHEYQVPQALQEKLQLIAQTAAFQNLPKSVLDKKLGKLIGAAVINSRAEDRDSVFDEMLRQEVLENAPFFVDSMIDIAKEGELAKAHELETMALLDFAADLASDEQKKEIQQFLTEDLSNSLNIDQELIAMPDGELKTGEAAMAVAGSMTAVGDENGKVVFAKTIGMDTLAKTYDTEDSQYYVNDSIAIIRDHAGTSVGLILAEKVVQQNPEMKDHIIQELQEDMPGIAEYLNGVEL